MKNNRIKVYLIALFVILLTIGFDQLTKNIASNRLATQRGGGFSHNIELVVPEEFNGKTLHDYIQAEFGENNTPEEISRIESSVKGGDGEKLTPESVLSAYESLVVGWREITVIPDYWDYQYTRNNGAAFSFLADTDSPYRTPFFIFISFVSVFVILWMLKGVTLNHKMQLFGLSLICGGAIGNVIDRVAYGYVIDFIVWKYTNEYRWPTFNIADAAIVAGVALLVLSIIFDRPSAEQVVVPTKDDDTDEDAKRAGA